MSTPIVVQGTPVSYPQQAQAQQQYAQPARPSSNPPQRGEKQETRCNDIPFLVLFYLNVIAMAAVAVLYGPDALTADDDEATAADGDDASSSREYDGYVYAALICVVLSVLGSIVGMSIMMCIPETLIKAALIFVVVMAFIWMILSFLSGSLFGAVIGLIFFAISLCYARVVWPRIPFATANLVTAMTAIRANWGVITYAFVLTALAAENQNENVRWVFSTEPTNVATKRIPVRMAYIYVGLYGYPYLEAGKNVFTLFRNRGWEAIIADDLISNVLLMVSLIVGGVIGSIAIVIESTSDLFEDAGGNAKTVAFILGFIIGLVVCSIALSTIGSGVNAVVVLFAEAPAEFQQNHPRLSERMRSAWSLVYPGSV
eukprot:scaffold6395_cov159-Amphora_coffeaeformis.AAC.2